MHDASPGPSPLQAAYRAWSQDQPRRQPLEPLWRDRDGWLLARLPARSRVPLQPADRTDVGTTAEL